MHLLSKSRYIRGLQCEKALYLDSFRPELARVSFETRQKFAAGRGFEAEYKSLFPKGIDVSKECKMNLRWMLARTAELLQQEGEVDLFEAAFQSDGVLILADVVHKAEEGQLTVYEVKNTKKVTPVIRHDVYLQHYVLGNTPTIFVAYHDAEGQFLTEDLTEEAQAHADFVREHVARQKEVLAGLEPMIKMSDHCTNPYECPYMAYCRGEISTQINLQAIW